MKRALLCLACFALAGLFPARGQRPPALSPYVAPSRLYTLRLPAEWSVREDSRAGHLHVLAQSRDERSFVAFQCQERKGTLLEALTAFRARLAQRFPGVRVEGVWMSPDHTRAVASWRGADKLQGRLYGETGPQGITVQGYGAPEGRLPQERPLLLNIMASLTFIKGNPGGPQKIAFLDPPLVKRRAPDGSASLSIPEDWQFQGGGGKVAASAPRGAAGFIFTSFQGNPMLPGASVAQGVIGSRYLPPQQAMEAIFRGLGHREFRVTSSEPDQASMREYQARFHKGCDAQDLMATWISAKGTPCVGAFKVVDALPSPMGQWFIIVAGVWGPQEEFYRHYPLLEKVAHSFAINDQFARQYIQAGLENLHRLQQQTMARMQELNQARVQNQADWEARQQRKDFMESKWDDYRRGQSYWVSDLEGGKVYLTDVQGTKDATTGDYYEGRPYNYVNFEGQNPRHPSENMREISSYELKHLNDGR